METKSRHGFVTFWLWLGIVANVLSTPFMIVSYQKVKDSLDDCVQQLMAAGIDIDPLFGSETGIYVVIMQLIALLSAIILIIGYSKLLSWKKAGFFLFAGVGIAAGIINIIMMCLIGREFMELGSYLDLDLNVFTTQQFVIEAARVVISILVLWAILQIRKNGVSCWKQLE